MSSKAYIAIGSLTVILLPLMVYCSKFGFVITADHDRWAQFGSALSGIYSPILGVLTFIVLIRQLELQAVITRHQLDQDVTGPARSDITHALDAIITATEVDCIPGQSRGQLLLTHFATASREDLLRDESYQLAMGVLFGTPNLFALWLQVSSTLVALRSHQSVTFQSAFASCNLKVTAKLGHFLCVGIENAYFAFLKGDLAHGSVLFSPVLNSREK